jgi:hypothetical protein
MATRHHSEHLLRDLILYSISSIILIYLSIKIISLGVSTKTLRCSSETEIEEGVTRETSFVLRWELGEITLNHVDITLNTTEKITEEQKEAFKKEINDSGYYKYITFGDYWDYKITLDADFIETKLKESLGGTTYDEIKEFAENTKLMTCQ